MDTTKLRNAYQTLLDAASTVAAAGETCSTPQDGEWDTEQVLAHVTLVNATTIAAVSAVAAGINTTYDNRIALDAWTIKRAITLTGGSAGLQARIRTQADALCTLGLTLSEPELNTMVPSRLLSNDEVLVDEPVPLKELITGLAAVEIPAHTQQLLDLLPKSAPPEA
ncbi:hypothetical protein [Arthrobacter sp. ISL-30]|uniref:hypothetical protein n=1 Tax=Arthrobacter sp. ISL-30 TaxID=2819109 RepID=UPI001BE6CDD5|nr:hypothetical protein [Arthrobacter sp. ISL-30]MBT2515792.1 hypothetical protein [Arthrobacter sp. ISL-30]